MKKAIYSLVLVLLATLVYSGTNSVNIIPDPDCERGNTSYWGWSSTTQSINKSPTKSLTMGILTYYKVAVTKKVAIDGTKNYDLSNWVASSNYFKSGGTALPLGIVLRTYDESDNQLSSKAYFTNGGYEGFTTNGIYEGMVFQEALDIEIPDEAVTFDFRIQIDRAASGRIWLDNFYLGEVETDPMGTVLIVQ